MLTDIGEFIVGAHLKLVRGCDFVDYNIRFPGGGLKGLEELDVIGLHMESNTAYICEVATHIDGLVYGRNYDESIERVHMKFRRQQEYADKHLTQFNAHVLEFWSPRVPKGRLSKAIEDIDGLEPVINEEYTKRVDELRTLAKKMKNDTRNPFFRMLQIMEHLRR
jgi:hypothetical protein